MEQTDSGVQLASMQQHNQHEIAINVASDANTETPAPNPNVILDLLTGDRREYIRTGIPLYEASIKGDWNAAEPILGNNPAYVKFAITENHETALHVAASAKRSKRLEEFLRNLVMDWMEPIDLTLVNKNKNTALCLAAAAGNIDAVKIMLEKNGDLVAIPGSQEMPPLYMAALFKSYEVVKYLYEKDTQLNGKCWMHRPEYRGWLLQKCVEADMFDVALQIVKDHREDPHIASNYGNVLRVLARKPDAFFEKRENFFMRTINLVMCPKLRACERESKALQLLRIIWHDIAEKDTNSIDEILRGPADPVTQGANTTYSSRTLFIAAEMGNTKFLVELIRLYPGLIWKVNDNNQTIFHIAVKHRHRGIYNLLYEIGSNKDMITPLKDGNDNNMLHLVGEIAKKKRLEDVSGVSLQMQRELLWFKEVEEMIPPSYRERKNKDGLTPYELFSKKHKDLVTQGEKWMKDTASHCMVVATLIATILFAAAFTVPGGYSQSDTKSGFPVFHQKVIFKVFVVADAISLFLSSTSILVFLSILTSRYAERDFLESLPTKLMFGLTTLFLSITTMMVAFSVSFFVLYHKHLIWMPIVIAVVAIMPVLLYALLQYPLLGDVIRSTYGSRYLFKPKKHVLYYED